MFSRVAAGIVLAGFAWTASCYNNAPTDTITAAASGPTSGAVHVLAYERPLPATTTTKPPVTTTRPVVTTPPTTTTTTIPIGAYQESIEDELRRIFQRVQTVLLTEYPYYSRGPNIVALQELLGMRQVDGVYGPQTRAVHIESLGGPRAAIRLWYPPTWGEGLYEYYPHYLPSDEDPYGYGSGCHNRLPDPYTCERLPTLEDLVNTYFLPEDRAWAFRVAFCESSGRPEDVFNEEVSHALAVGWFQHLKKYWETGYRKGRAWDAGFGGYSIFDPIANVGVAAHLFYTSGDQHWNPSKSCWKDTTHA